MPVCLIQAASLPWHIATPKTTATSLYPTGQASMRSIQALQTFEKGIVPMSGAHKNGT